MVSGLLKGQFTQITKTCSPPPQSCVDQSYLGCIGKHHRNQSEVQAALLDVLILNLCHCERIVSDRTKQRLHS